MPATSMSRSTMVSELSVSVTRLPALQSAAVRLEAQFGPDHPEVARVWGRVAAEAELVCRNARALAGGDIK